MRDVRSVKRVAASSYRRAPSAFGRLFNFCSGLLTRHGTQIVTRPTPLPPQVPSAGQQRLAGLLLFLTDVGLNLFVLSTISNAPIGEVIRGILLIASKNSHVDSPPHDATLSCTQPGACHYSLQAEREMAEY